MTAESTVIRDKEDPSPSASTKELGDEDDEEKREELQAAPPKVGTWLTAALIVLAYQIGVGVMSLPSALAQLGYVLGIFSILAWATLSIFIGLWMREVKSTWTTALSYADASFHAFNGSRLAKNLIGTLVYLNFFLLIGEFLLVQSQSLTMVFYDVKVCSIVWIVVCVAFDVPLQQFRILSLPAWMMVLNIIMIMAALLVSLISLTVTDSPEDSLSARNATVSVTAPPTLDVFRLFTSQALLAFSFAYGTVTLETMSEMKDFRDFRKSIVFASTPFSVSIYLLSAIWGYTYLGTSVTGLLIQNIPQGPAYRAAGCFLFFHISVTTTITATVLGRALHRAVSPKTINSFTLRGILTNLAISLTVTIFAAGLALGIPIFESLTSLVGSLTIPTLAYILPMVFTFKAKQRRKERVSILLIASWLAIGTFLILLTVIGTAGTVIDVIAHWQSQSGSLQYQNC